MSGTIPNQFKANIMTSEKHDSGGEEEEEEEEEGEEDNNKEPGSSSRPTTGPKDESDGGTDSRTSLMTRSAPLISSPSSTSSTVRVALRIRPLLAREVIANARECINVTPNEPQVWIAGTHAFTYDYVFKTDAGQDEIFNSTAKPLVDGILEGYNATILAYGQTGSGKTYTMGTGFDPEVTTSITSASTPPTLGLLPRCISYLFGKIHEATVHSSPPPDFKVCVQFTELYNEEVIDLLSESPIIHSSRPATAQKSSVKIHEDAQGGIYLVNIHTKPVSSALDTLDTLKTGALNRTTASTNMNDSSSRSHAIFSIMVTQSRVVRDKNGASDIETLHAKFHFVDLAGSERLKRTLATGDRAREGIAINSGLLALGNVISALGDKSKKSTHVPYRDSKLTRLLQDSLGGNSRTMMIACVSPNELDFVETLNTMKYANRAKNIRNKVVVNQDKSSRTISLLKEEISRLNAELNEYKRGGGGRGDGEGGDVTAENIMLLAEVESLKSKLKAKQDTIDKLTSQVARLQALTVAEEMVGNCDFTNLVSKYLHEIEDLRGKLYESESECEKLRAKQMVILKNLNSPRDMASSYIAHQEESVQNLISKAKEELSAEKSVLEKIPTNRSRRGNKPSNNNIISARVRKTSDRDSGDSDDEKVLQKQKQQVKVRDNNEDQEVNDDEDEEEDEEEEEEESDEDDDSDEEDSSSSGPVDPNAANYNELASLSVEISMKQRLIEEIENSHLRLESMRASYEAKLGQLIHKIKATEEERDLVLKTRGAGSARNDKIAEYENTIKKLQGELKSWNNAKKEHAKMIRNQSNYEGQVLKLKREVEEMKKIKVKLMNQVKNENLRHREMEKIKVKEITQLRKESRKQEVRVRKLESEIKLKEAVHKRKFQECEMLKNRNRVGIIRGGGGFGVGGGGRRNSSGMSNKSSPVKGKQAWSRIQSKLIKDVNSRTTVASLERDMVGLISRRSELNSMLVGENDPEEIDSIQSNLRLVEDKIRVVQEDIVCSNQIEEGRDEEDVKGGRFSVKISGAAGLIDLAVGNHDYAYVLEKLYDQSVSSMSEVGMLEGRVRETEEVNRHLQREVETLRDLLHHLYTRKQSASSSDQEQFPDNKLESLLMPPPPVQVGGGTAAAPSSSSANATFVKARRRLTATTQELLGGSTESLELLSDVTPPSNIATTNNNRFTRNTRLTQSMRAAGSAVPSNNNNNKGGGGGKRMLTRQDTYAVIDSNVMNSTFLVEGSNNSDPNNSTNNKVTLQRSVSEIVDQSGPYSGSGGSSSRPATRSATNNPTAASCNIPVPNTTLSGSGSVKSPRGNAWLQLTQQLEGHTKPVLCLSSTSNVLVSGSKDGTCRVWDLETSSELACYDGHPHNVSCVCHVPDLNLVLTGSSYQVKIFDTRTNTPVKVLCSSGLPSSSTGGFAQPAPIPSLPQSTPLPRVNDLPTGEKSVHSIQAVRNYFFTSFGERIRIWDLRRLNSIGILAGKHNSSVMCITGMESGFNSHDWVITGSKDHTIKVYEYEPNTPPDQITSIKNLNPPHYDGIECLLLGERGSLYSGSRDTCIKKWDLGKLKMVSTVTNAHSGWITGLANVPGVAGDKSEYVISSSRDGSLKVWDSSRDFREIARFENSQSLECVNSNDRLVFFGGANNNSTSNGNAISNDGLLGVYKINENWAKNMFANNNNMVLPNTVTSRTGSGGSSNSYSNNNNNKLQTQYLTSNLLHDHS